MPDDEEDPRHDSGAVLATIKATHAAGGLSLSPGEAIAFITTPFYMGLPKVRDKGPGSRGPKHRKTQYDLAYERRRYLYRLLVKLPGLGRAAGWESRPEYLATLQVVLADRAIPARLKARAVLMCLARFGQAAPAERTVRRHLAAAKKGGPGK